MGTSFSDRLSRQGNLLSQPNPHLLFKPVVTPAHAQLDGSWEVGIEVRALRVERVVNGRGTFVRQLLDRLAVDQRAFKNR